jgi:hypothetical protein
MMLKKNMFIVKLGNYYGEEIIWKIMSTLDILQDDNNQTLDIKVDW